MVRCVRCVHLSIYFAEADLVKGSSRNLLQGVSCSAVPHGAHAPSTRQTIQ